MSFSEILVLLWNLLKPVQTWFCLIFFFPYVGFGALRQERLD